MKNILASIVIILVIGVLILGFGPLLTKLDASREAIHKRVTQATSDDVLLNEYEIELKNEAEQNADAQIELSELIRDRDLIQRRVSKLEDRLATHNEALQKEQAMLATNKQAFVIRGQRIPRQRVEQDVSTRLSICHELEEDIRNRGQVLAAHEASLTEFRTQIEKATAEYQSKYDEFKRLKVELRTARVTEGLKSRLNAISALGENGNLARLEKEIRKRINRSRTRIDWHAPASDAGLLDLNEPSSTSVKEDLDEYLNSIAKVSVVDSVVSESAQSEELLEVLQ